MSDEGRRQSAAATRINHRRADRSNGSSRERTQLLERHGRAYGAEQLAIAFTAGIVGEGAKRCMTRNWEATAPLPDADFGAGLVGNRGRGRNPAIVLRPSRLIGLECDTAPDLEAIERLGLPATATVRSSAESRRHFYFRLDPELERVPYVCFRFESGRVTADSSRYFVAPPAIHPCGVVYEFLPGLALDEIGFATMPVAVYKRLTNLARGSSSETRSGLREVPDAKVPPGRRGDMIFRYACALRRWTADRDEILLAAGEWNRRHCDPPIELERVELQVDGAMRKQGSQALRSVG